MPFVVGGLVLFGASFQNDLNPAAIVFGWYVLLSRAGALMHLRGIAEVGIVATTITGYAYLAAVRAMCRRRFDLLSASPSVAARSRLCSILLGASTRVPAVWLNLLAFSSASCVDPRAGCLTASVGALLPDAECREVRPCVDRERPRGSLS